MEIKETKIREIYKDEVGLNYYDKPMKYMEWRKERLIKLMEENEQLKVVRDDPESYPDNPKAKRINYKQAVWVEEIDIN